MAPPNRQRNPTLAARPGRLKLSVIEDGFRQASLRSRSPTRLSPIARDRQRRRSSSSNASRAAGSLFRGIRNSSKGDGLDNQDQSLQHESTLAFPLLSPQDSSPFPPLSPQLSIENFDEPVFADDEPPSQVQSPAQPSAPGWQIPTQPQQPPRTGHRAQSAQVKDGQMIRITLRTQTTEVPCIAKCYLNRPSSVADNDFARNWGVKIHPVPKPRWRDARHWCVLDVIDVETVGSIQEQLHIRLGKLQDQRFSLELGVDALKTLGLVDESEAISQLSRSAPPSQYPLASGLIHSYLQQPQDVLDACMLTPPAPQQSTGLRNRALTVPSITIDTTFATSLPVPPPMYESTSASSSTWDVGSIASQSFQDDDKGAWSPAVSDCGGLSSSYDTCWK
ncbi:hypothetical protein NW762_004392 [Fusarium torreyae]|uniref:Uncharacterized protein n=1 Tax=Fusarium torreyae TaxID=1237075 RepID=A0A9W8S8V2_9HYPO|nr:hypothetical protein NW762_004392 [Fusarium torreyae]